MQKNLRTVRDELQCIFLRRSVWPSVSIAHLREVTDPRADPLHTHNSVTWFYPFLLLSDQKYPTNLTRYQRAEERSCYRRVPSLPSHPRAEEEPWVWSRQTLPGGIWAATTSGRALSQQRHPNVLKHCSTHLLCTPCFYLRSDTVIVISVANTPQKHATRGFWVSCLKPVPLCFALKTQNDCQNG